ncbi:MAG: hypothetical protein JWM64_625 [Frankiales bacterium]|nr:hypothetical protein [Frankiales bacterium]
MSVDLLDRESRSLVQRLRLWTPQRWAASCLPGLSRGDVVHHLAAVLVEAAGETTLPLPRLAADLALPDQLAVAAADLVALDPPTEVAVVATAHLLLHRHDLLDDDVPAGLAQGLGLPDVLAAGRAQCHLNREGTAADGRS